MKTKMMALILTIVMLTTMVGPVMAAENAEEATVGVLTLFAANTGSSNEQLDFGHVFLEFRNTSGRSVLFGDYMVPDQGGVTVSVWLNIDGKQGIIYNADSFLHYNKGRYSNRVSISIPVNAVDISTINAYIRDDDNDRYSVTQYNCVDFCLGVWYSVCSDYFFADTTPSSPHVLYSSIQQFSEHEEGATIYWNETVCYLGSEGWVYIPRSAINGNSFLEIEEPEEEPVLG